MRKEENEKKVSYLVLLFGLRQDINVSKCTEKTFPPSLCDLDFGDTPELLWKCTVLYLLVWLEKQGQSFHK